MFDPALAWQFILALFVLVQVIFSMRSARQATENKERITKVEVDARTRIIEAETAANEALAQARQFDRVITSNSELVKVFQTMASAQQHANEIANAERENWREIIQSNAEAKLALASAVEVNTSTLANIQSDMANRFLTQAQAITEAKQQAIEAIEAALETSADNLSGKIDNLRAVVETALQRMETGRTTSNEMRGVLERVSAMLDALPKPSAHDLANATMATRLTEAVKAKTAEIAVVEPNTPPKDAAM